MAIPTTTFYQFSSSGINPVGSRHLKTHASFIKELSASSSGVLDFGTIDISAKSHSPTKAIVFRTSNLNGGTRIENMRFWAPELPAPIGTIKYNMKILAAYVSGLALTDSSGQVPSTLPDSANLKRTDGHTAISGTGDTEVSQWIYLNVTGNTDLVTGRYGGSSSYRYRTSFDYI